MINPNIKKEVLVNKISADFAIYKGQEIMIYYDHLPNKLGKRKMYLKYTIIGDKYYLISKR